MKKENYFYIGILHGVVFLWGASGLVGEQINMSSTGIVFYRMLLAAICLGLFIYFYQGRKIFLPVRETVTLLGSGAVLAAHWWLFFQSIKVSTISVGLICLSSAPFFLALLEPLVLRKKLKGSELLLGVFCVGSLLLIYSFESHYVLGIILGMLAAFTDSFYSILTTHIGRRQHSTLVTFYQMLGGTLTVTLLGAISQGSMAWILIPQLSDFYGLLFLGVVCSAIAMASYINCLKHLPTFTAVLSLNLEPVYGIILALLIHGEKEKMSAGFYLWALVLIVCVSVDVFLKNRASAA